MVVVQAADGSQHALYTFYFILPRWWK